MDYHNRQHVSRLMSILIVVLLLMVSGVVCYIVYDYNHTVDETQYNRMLLCKSVPTVADSEYCHTLFPDGIPN